MGWATPFAAVYPQSRLLYIIGVGGSALVGLAVASWRRGELVGLGRRIVIGVVLFCNLVLAPLLAIPLGFMSKFLNNEIRIQDEVLPESGDVVVLLDIAAEGNALCLDKMREVDGRGMSDHLYLLYAGTTPVDIDVQHRAVDRQDRGDCCVRFLIGESTPPRIELSSPR